MPEHLGLALGWVDDRGLDSTCACSSQEKTQCNAQKQQEALLTVHPWSGGLPEEDIRVVSMSVSQSTL